ncbi:MAG: RNA polymerase sigma factor [Planctomycetota bacterium]
MTAHVIENLVLQAQKGDEAAYAQLIRLQYKRVYLLCYGIIGDEHHAEDVSQEAFMKGFMKLKSLRTPAHFDRWIGKIAKNLAISLQQRQKNHVSLQENITPAADCQQKPGRFAALNEAIQELPIDLRTPLVMYYFDGRKVPIVAQTLGVSNSNVYLRLRTALSQLKEAIRKGEME